MQLWVNVFFCFFFLSVFCRFDRWESEGLPLPAPADAGWLCVGEREHRDVGQMAKEEDEHQPCSYARYDMHPQHAPCSCLRRIRISRKGADLSFDAQFTSNPSEIKILQNICSHVRRFLLSSRLTVKQPDLRQGHLRGLHLLSWAARSTNPSSSRVSFNSWCVWWTGERAGQRACRLFTGHLMRLSRTSRACAVCSTHTGLPHTPDCFSDQPHPSRAHSAGTLPSRAADVRGDLQRHAAGWRGAQGRGGDGGGGLGGLKWRGKLAEFGYVTFWRCFFTVCGIHWRCVDSLNVGVFFIVCVFERKNHFNNFCWHQA